MRSIEKASACLQKSLLLILLAALLSAGWPGANPMESAAMAVKESCPISVADIDLQPLSDSDRGNSRLTLQVSTLLQGSSLEVSIIQIKPSGALAPEASQSGDRIASAMVSMTEPGRYTLGSGSGAGLAKGSVDLTFFAPGGPCRPAPGMILALVVSTPAGAAIRASATIPLVTSVSAAALMESSTEPSQENPGSPVGKVLERPDGTRIFIGRSRP